jgi:transposase
MARAGVPMPITKRTQYTPEFKEEAVRLLESDTRSVEEIAASLGVNPTLLQKWRVKLRGMRRKVASLEDAVSPDEREELRRLRKRLKEVEEERDILKKATAFFAKQSK